MDMNVNRFLLDGRTYHMEDAGARQSIVNLTKESTDNVALMKTLAERRNILHNWDFRNPVNQRGHMGYTRGHTIDRWRIADSSPAIRLEIVSGGVKLTNNGPGLAIAMHQRIEFPHLYLGKTFTASVMHEDEVCQTTFGLPQSMPAERIDIRSDEMPFGVQICVTVGSSGVRHPLNFFLYLLPGVSATIQAVKLEFGTASTLANDPPMDFGRELAVCQRYYETSYSYGVLPGTATSAGMQIAIAYNPSRLPGSRFKVSKRIKPVVILFGRAGGRNRITTTNSLNDLSYEAVALNSSSQDTGIIRTRGLETGGSHRFHWVADANL